MAQNDFNQFFNINFAQPNAGMNLFPFDFTSLMDAQRKNMEALATAQQLTLESLQAVAQRQSELLTSLMQDQSDMARDVLSESTPEQKVARQADLLKKTYEQSIASYRELVDMLNKSNQQASDVINKRVSASFSEIKTVMEQAEKQDRKKKAA